MQQLKKQEENFRNIAESIPQMVWSADAEGQSRYFNNKWFEYFGMSPKNVEDLNWLEYVHPDDQVRARSRWQQAQIEKLPYENEYRLKGKDGRYRWFLSRGVPIRNKDSQILKWMGTATDIHENKEALRLRDELLVQLDKEIIARKIQQAQLQQAIRTRDEFMSMASHELKTPLTSLQLQTQMCKKILGKEGLSGLSPDKIGKLVQTFDNQVKRLSRLIDDMLDVSRINQGRLPLHFESFELGQWVGDIIERFNDLCEKPEGYGISVSINSVNVNLDRHRIEQVVVNLLSNAIKYGAGSPVQVRVFEENRRAKIVVTDAGSGVAKENHDRIFKPFERAISSRQMSGLGLGLHIAGQIATAHSGSIRIQSELGMGASFIVDLPVAENKFILSAVE